MIDLTFMTLGTDGVIGASSWRTISQGQIDLFAQATDDFQFIHVDPVRAAAEAPFGGTIAHGFLTLSLISTLAAEVIPLSAQLKSVIMAGIDKVKFMTPLPAGGSVRGLFKLERYHLLSDTRMLVKIFTTIESKATARPVLTCEVSWIMELAAAGAESASAHGAVLGSVSSGHDRALASSSS